MLIRTAKAVKRSKGIAFSVNSDKWAKDPVWKKRTGGKYTPAVHLCVHVRVYLSVHMCAPVCARVCMCTHVHVHVCACGYVFVCTCRCRTCIHTQMHTLVKTHAVTRMHTAASPALLKSSVFKLHLVPPGEIIKSQITKPTPRVSDSVDLGWPRIGCSRTFSEDNAAAADQGTLLRHCLRESSPSLDSQSPPDTSSRVGINSDETQPLRSVVMTWNLVHIGNPWHLHSLDLSLWARATRPLTVSLAAAPRLDVSVEAPTVPKVDVCAHQKLPTFRIRPFHTGLQFCADILALHVLRYQTEKLSTSNKVSEK